MCSLERNPEMNPESCTQIWPLNFKMMPIKRDVDIIFPAAILILAACLSFLSGPQSVPTSGVGSQLLSDYCRVLPPN
jgi:hypothetical protein